MARLMLDLPEEIGSTTETVELAPEPVDPCEGEANGTQSSSEYENQQSDGSEPHVVRWYRTWAGRQ